MAENLTRGTQDQSTVSRAERAECVAMCDGAKAREEAVKAERRAGEEEGTNSRSHRHIHTSCQPRHRRARAAPDTASGRIIGHRSGRRETGRVRKKQWTAAQQMACDSALTVLGTARAARKE
eukprot:5341739-Prymnesium_polylepis.1